MEIWIAVALLGLIAAGIGINRVLARASSNEDLGVVSQSWLIETRAKKGEY